MISQEDFNFIVAFDTPDSSQREELLNNNPDQCAQTFLNLLGHVSKDQTLQYILVLMDDMLQVIMLLCICIKLTIKLLGG